MKHKGLSTVGFVQCPYCHHENSFVLAPLPYVKSDVVTCDCDEGPGCGREFVINYRAVVEVKARAFAYEAAHARREDEADAAGVKVDGVDDQQ